MKLIFTLPLLALQISAVDYTPVPIDPTTNQIVLPWGLCLRGRFNKKAVTTRPCKNKRKYLWERTTTGSLHLKNSNNLCLEVKNTMGANSKLVMRNCADKADQKFVINSEGKWDLANQVGNEGSKCVFYSEGRNRNIRYGVDPNYVPTTKIPETTGAPSTPGPPPPCDADPCNNAGICTNQIASFSCDCSESTFTDETCTSKNLTKLYEYYNLSFNLKLLSIGTTSKYRNIINISDENEFYFNAALPGNTDLTLSIKNRYCGHGDYSIQIPNYLKTLETYTISIHTEIDSVYTTSLVVNIENSTSHVSIFQQPITLCDIQATNVLMQSPKPTVSLQDEPANAIVTNVHYNEIQNPYPAGLVIAGRLLQYQTISKYYTLSFKVKLIDTGETNMTWREIIHIGDGFLSRYPSVYLRKGTNTMLTIKNTLCDNTIYGVTNSGPETVTTGWQYDTFYELKIETRVDPTDSSKNRMVVTVNGQEKVYGNIKVCDNNSQQPVYTSFPHVAAAFDVVSAKAIVKDYVYVGD